MPSADHRWAMPRVKTMFISLPVPYAAELERAPVGVVEVVEHDLADQVADARGVHDQRPPRRGEPGAEQVGQQERRQVVDLEVRLVTVVGPARRGEGAAGVVHQHLEFSTRSATWAARRRTSSSREKSATRARCRRPRPPGAASRPSARSRGPSRPGRPAPGRSGPDPVAGPGHQDRAARHRLLAHAASLRGRRVRPPRGAGKRARRSPGDVPARGGSALRRQPVAGDRARTDPCRTGRGPVVPHQLPSCAPDPGARRAPGPARRPATAPSWRTDASARGRHVRHRRPQRALGLSHPLHRSADRA